MAGSAETAGQSKVAREIQSSNEEVSQHISTFWLTWYLAASWRIMWKGIQQFGALSMTRQSVLRPILRS